MTDALVAIGIAFLIVRQFIWRSAEIGRMLRMPVIVIAAGIVTLGTELVHARLVPEDWWMVVELVLVAGTGTAMGYVTRFRTTSGRLQYKLTAPGVGLWVVFIAVRVASFFAEAALGAHLADGTGIILISFGVNRLAASVVVRHRTEHILAMAHASPTVNVV